MKKLFSSISCFLIVATLSMTSVFAVGNMDSSFEQNTYNTESVYNVDDTNVASSNFENDTFDIESDLLKSQYLASEDNEQILEYFNSQVKSNSESQENYPDYYGGSYINTNGELVVLLTENENKIQDTLKTVSENPDLNFEIVDYSYNELTNIINDIGKGITQNLQTPKTNKISDEENIYDYINGTVLLDDKNKIEVYIENLDDAKIAEFKEEFPNSNMFIFKEAVEGIDESATSAPGERIYAPLGGLSTAFRVRRTLSNGMEQRGFLTCGHGTGYGSSILDNNGGLLGTVRMRVYEGNADVSFVEYSSGSSVSNTIDGTNYYSLSTSVATPVVGKMVFMYGATSGKTYGYIQSTNVSFTHNSTYFSDIIGASYPSDNGDSGAVICSDYSNYSYKTMGIHKGQANGYHVFTSFSRIKNDLNLTRY